MLQPNLLDRIRPVLATGPQRDSQDAHRFLVRLTRALHTCGLSAPELEEAVQGVGEALGLHALALVSPTSLFLSFPGPDAPELHLERVEPGEIDLGRLVDLEALVDEVRAGTLGAREALAALDELERSGSPYAPAWTLAGFSIASLAAGILFQVPGRDLPTVAGLGLAVGALAVLSGGRPRLARVSEPLSALLATIVALLLAHAGLVSDPDAVALAALIVLVPGYGLTVALTELACRHLTSGTTRLFGALGTFLGLGLGVGLGLALVERTLGPITPVPSTAPGLGATLAALLMTPLAFGVLFQVRPRHLGWVALGGLTAYTGARTGTWLVGPELGAGLGALALGLTGNVIARWKGLPSALAVVPGILLLVPGSIGFRSVAQFLRHDALAGVETGFRMAYVATCLVGGLLASYALLPPRSRFSRSDSSGRRVVPSLDPLQPSPAHAASIPPHPQEEVVTPQGLEP